MKRKKLVVSCLTIAFFMQQSMFVVAAPQDTDFSEKEHTIQKINPSNNEEKQELNHRLFKYYDKIEYNTICKKVAYIQPKAISNKYSITTKILNTEENITTLGKGSDYAGQEVEIVREAKTSAGIWYQFSYDNHLIGWMNREAFQLYGVIEYKNIVNDEKIIRLDTLNYSIYDDIYNTKPDIKEVGKISEYRDHVVKVVTEAKTNNTVWYEIEDENHQILGWVNAQAFADVHQVEYDTITNFSNAKIRESGKNAPIFSGIPYTSLSTQPKGTGKDFIGKKLHIVREAKSNDSIWYKFKSGNQTGWISEHFIQIDNLVTYQTCVENYGWLAPSKSGEVSGEFGKRLEGIKIAIKDADDIGIRYQSHMQDYGWDSVWKEKNQIAGVLGENKRLEAIKLELTGTNKEKYDIYYRVYAQNFGWMDWAKNGQEAGTEGYGYRLEAMEVKLVDKGKKAPEKTTTPYRKKENKEPEVYYTSHVQDYGWHSYKSNGQKSGTVGKAKRLEGMKVHLSTNNLGGSIEYATHVQNIGWQEYVRDNQLSGTTGLALRLEGMKIRLTGEISQSYDVYYRVHAQDYGWLGWAKNGEAAGTVGQSKRLEAMEIQIRKKNNPLPSYGKTPALYGSVSGKTAQGRFINRVIPHVQKVAKKNDLYASVMIAQACLESGNGTSKLSREPYNNLFGIKGTYNGQFVWMFTQEEVNGQMITVKAKFRKYPSMTQSFEDNAKSLRYGVTWNPNIYRGTWRSTTSSYKDATRALTGTYATDSRYGAKLNAIIQAWDLTQFD